MPGQHTHAELRVLSRPSPAEGQTHLSVSIGRQIRESEGVVRIPDIALRFQMAGDQVDDSEADMG